MSSTMVLTRHGGTPLSRPEQHLGQRLNPGLDEEGRAAAAALGERLRGVAFDAVYASPLLRAVETAHLVVPGRGIRTDGRLAEMDYGAWEGRTYEQIRATDGAARAAWEADPASLAVPGGETGEEVAARVRSFLADAIALSSQPASEPGLTSTRSLAPSEPAASVDRRILVIAHSTTNRVLLCVALGVPLRDYRRRFQQVSCNLTVLQFDASADQGALLLVGNDVAHLRGIRGVTWG